MHVGKDKKKNHANTFLFFCMDMHICRDKNDSQYVFFFSIEIQDQSSAKTEVLVQSPYSSFLGE